MGWGSAAAVGCAMKKRHAPVDGLHAIWSTVRGPFYAVDCAGGLHKWERYDASRAGCLVCGAVHECKDTLVDSKCPLVAHDDGSVSCTVTGLCLQVVRYSRDDVPDGALCVCGETLASTVAAAPRKDGAVDLRDRVEDTVRRFVFGAAAAQARAVDVERAVEQCAQSATRVLKATKVASEEYPCLPSVIAEVLGRVKARRYDEMSQGMYQRCVEGITRCMVDMGVGAHHAKCEAMVVGMLFLMKQGLKLRNREWLPKVHQLGYCLPHESCLDKFPGLSMKIICETENAIKLALRQQVRTL